MKTALALLTTSKWQRTFIFTTWISGFFLSILLILLYRNFSFDGKMLIIPNQILDCVLAMMNIFLGPLSSISYFMLHQERSNTSRELKIRFRNITVIVTLLIVAVVLLFVALPMFHPLQPDDDLVRSLTDTSLIAGVIIAIIVTPLNIIVFSD